MDEQQPQSSSMTERDEMPNRISMLFERVDNIKDDVRNINEKLDRWDAKNDDFLKFKAEVVGMVKATQTFGRVAVVIFGVILTSTLGWIGAVNLGLAGAQQRLTTLEVTAAAEDKAISERNHSIDDRLNGFDRHNSNTDADLEKLKIDNATKKR